MWPVHAVTKCNPPIRCTCQGRRQGYQRRLSQVILFQDFGNSISGFPPPATLFFLDWTRRSLLFATACLASDLATGSCKRINRIPFAMWIWPRRRGLTATPHRTVRTRLWLSAATTWTSLLPTLNLDTINITMAHMGTCGHMWMPHTLTAACMRLHDLHAA